MVTREKFLDAFGELIYALALADGLIQPEEISALQHILQKYDWANAVEWSFQYEKNRQQPLEKVYANALETFREYGPAPEYQDLIEVLEAVAQASAGIDSHEQKIIAGFQTDLKAKFIQDLENGRLL
ncbi:MAG: TerB family tellurite resistance protein [Microscillaceae bacterium]|jgi:uncharacterized tellurite resistance protein B-like protein|nr:TerB family tellurite resistance protein [Microscillaceae bacterium]